MRLDREESDAHVVIRLPAIGSGLPEGRDDQSSKPIALVSRGSWRHKVTKQILAEIVREANGRPRNPNWATYVTEKLTVTSFLPGRHWIEFRYEDDATIELWCNWKGFYAKVFLADPKFTDKLREAYTRLWETYVVMRGEYYYRGR